MSSEQHVHFELEDTPDEVVRKVAEQTERAERALIKRGDPTKARRAFRRARQRNVKVLSAVKVQYNLNQEEIKRFIGRDVSDINDDLMTFASEMMRLKIEQNKTGEANVEPDLLLDIQATIDELWSFHDLLVGIEESEAQIQANG